MSIHNAGRVWQPLSQAATGDPSQNVYSTGETVIGTWIDGRPIYRYVEVDESFKWLANLGVNKTVNTTLHIDFLINARILYKAEEIRILSDDIMYLAVHGNGSLLIKKVSEKTAVSGVYIVMIAEYVKTTDLTNETT